MRFYTLAVSFAVSCLLAVEAIHLRQEESKDKATDDETSEITIMQADPAPEGQTPATDIEETALATSNVSDSKDDKTDESTATTDLKFATDAADAAEEKSQKDVVACALAS